MNVNRLGQINEIQAVRSQPMPLSPSCFHITTDQNQNLLNVCDGSDDLKAHHSFHNKGSLCLRQARFHSFISNRESCVSHSGGNETAFTRIILHLFFYSVCHTY